VVNFTPTGESVIVKSKPVAVWALDLSSDRIEVTDNKKLQEVLNRVCGTAFVKRLTLSGLPISGSALFGREVRKLPVIKQLRRSVELLDLSRTDCTATLFRLLPDFSNLRRLVCDECPKLHLLNVEKHEKLEEVSILGSNVMPQALVTFLKTFPALNRLDCTINLSDMVPLGLMHRHGLKHPVVTLCYGHVTTASKEEFLPLFTLAVRLQKLDGVWKAFLLDVEKKPILGDGQMWMHKQCRQFFQSPKEECPACQVKAVQEDFQYVDLLLDSSLDLDRDFALLPERAPYDLVRRSQFIFNGK